MTTAIMQPYLLPYLGYWQLIDSVDIFVIYDDAQYLKGGWINRNRIIVNGHDRLFSLPIAKAPVTARINERRFAEPFLERRRSLLDLFANSYRHAPYFKDIFPCLEETFSNDKTNVATFLEHQIRRVCQLIGIRTLIVSASSINISSGTSGAARVIALAKAIGGTQYVNAIGGKVLYSKDHFLAAGIDLRFLRVGELNYDQSDTDWIPHLSIVDVLMNCGVDETKKLLIKKVIE